jgi:hypothetical protein
MTAAAPLHEPVDSIDPGAYLLNHPNWERLGPKRQEIAMLLALNEYDPYTNTLSNAANVELERKYRYTRDQFKNTFKALRALGISRPHEQFEEPSSADRRGARGRGRYQIASRYTLEATKDGGPWVCAPRKQKRKLEPVRKAGKLLFTAAEDAEIQSVVRGRGNGKRGRRGGR